LRKSDEVDRYSWQPVPADTVKVDPKTSTDKVVAAEAKFGLGPAVYQVDVNRLPVASPTNPSVLRQVILHLRR
jgi:hypothetical protein